MLAQLDASEGRFDTARALAREAVTRLEGIGTADAAKARAILKNIPAGAAGGLAPGNARMAELQAILARATAVPPPQGIAEIDGALAAARDDPQPAREVLLGLARSGVCWRAHDAAGCDESLRRAREALGRVGDAEQPELTRLVEEVKARLAEAETGEAAESVRLHGEAVERLQDGDAAGALERFEQSPAAARRERNAHNEAMNLLALGHTLLERGRAAEAADRLREGLAVAEGLGDADLLKSLRVLATLAVQAQEAAKDPPP